MKNKLSRCSRGTGYGECSRVCGFFLRVYECVHCAVELLCAMKFLLKTVLCTQYARIAHIVHTMRNLWAMIVSNHCVQRHVMHTMIACNTCIVYNHCSNHCSQMHELRTQCINNVRNACATYIAWATHAMIIDYARIVCITCTSQFFIKISLCIKVSLYNTCIHLHTIPSIAE